MEVALGENPIILKLLLAARANVNATSYGVTALMYSAAYSIHSDSVRTLLTAGANVNAAATIDGSTGLMWAAQNKSGGSAEIVMALLAAGAEVNARRRPTQSTALMDAARAGSVESVTALIAAGADVTQSQQTERRPCAWLPQRDTRTYSKS